MSGDKELLELAAKAAGITNYKFNDYGFIVYFKETYRDSFGSAGIDIEWNPLEDDGDALRLAVKLHICVFNNGYVSWAATGSLQEVRAEEINNGDPYAATRRAVVRAAAAIGKEIKP